MSVPERLDYLFTLLGKKRLDQLREIKNYKSLPFDTLLNMADKNLILKDSLITKTSIDQDAVEEKVKRIYDQCLDAGEPLPDLHRLSHIEFLNDVISNPLPSGFYVLDASHPWMIFWCCNALKLLGHELDDETKKVISLNILSYVDSDNGGIGGGVGQLGHAASTYAAVCSLALSEDHEAWLELDRDSIYKWMMKMKQLDGSFTMHHNGEIDTRAVYCILTSASLLNILTPELVEGTVDWLTRCQTFEGGFGGTPYDEAHGGYTFCAVALLCLLGEPAKMLVDHCNLPNLVRWVAMRQLQLEGGFSGRTNKLVDGCYSHWVGGLIPFIELATGTDNICSRMLLSNYITMCCQSDKFPGLVDKPGKPTDFYHTNYVLCGLSMAQHKYYLDEKTTELIDSSAYRYRTEYIKDDSCVIVKEQDKLQGLNPIFGLPTGIAESMKSFYSK